MEGSAIWLRREGLINSRVGLIDLVLGRINSDQTAQRVEIGAVNPERAVVKTDRFVDLVLRQSYGSKVDIYVRAAGRRSQRRQEILPGRLGVSQPQSRRAVGDQRVSPQISQHLRRSVAIR